MSHRLISDLQTRVDRWFDTMMGDEARLRSYQRDLLAMRQLSPRPRCTVSLTLRQCAAARKDGEHARHALASCRNNIKELSVPITNEPSEQHRASRRGWPSCFAISRLPTPKLNQLPLSKKDPQGAYRCPRQCHAGHQAGGRLCRCPW